MSDDRQLLTLTHLSQLLTFITGCGGLIVPLGLWLTQRDRIYTMYEHGKASVNCQLSLLIYDIICVPLILLLGLGILGLIVIGILYFICPVINAIKASNGETPSYPLSLNIIS